jgi:hypothetical protein
MRADNANMQRCESGFTGLFRVRPFVPNNSGVVPRINSLFRVVPEFCKIPRITTWFTRLRVMAEAMVEVNAVGKASFDIISLYRKKCGSMVVLMQIWLY